MRSCVLIMDGESGESCVEVKMHVMTTSEHCEVEVGDFYRSICRGRAHDRVEKKARCRPLHVLSAVPSACYANTNRIRASAASSLRLQSTIETLQRPSLSQAQSFYSLPLNSCPPCCSSPLAYPYRSPTETIRQSTQFELRQVHFCSPFPLHLQQSVCQQRILARYGGRCSGSSFLGCNEGPE